MSVNETANKAAAEVPYENTAAGDWALKAIDFLRSRQLQVQAFDTDGVVSAQVWGTCPRCSHELNVQMTLSAPVIGLRGGRELWAALTRRDIPASPGIPPAVEIGCGCGYTHPGAPEQVTGCGVSFRLPTTPPDTAAASGR